LLEHAGECVGDPEAKSAVPLTFSQAGFDYEILGGRGSVGRPPLDRKQAAPAQERRIGVLSGIKDADPATLAALDKFLAAFEEAAVEMVLIGGDSGTEGSALIEVMRRVASRPWPVLAIAGNNESSSRFNRALRSVGEEHPNLINMDLTRVIQFPGLGVVSLPGYDLRAFSGSGASCLLHEGDIRALPALLSGIEGDSILLAHGPPKQVGPTGIDYVDGKTGNVGNALFSKMLDQASPTLLVAGHILESGARATDEKGREVKASTRGARHLYLNPGQVSTLPYKLNLGWISHGTAAIVTIKEHRVRWRLLKASPPG